MNKKVLDYIFIGGVILMVTVSLIGILKTYEKKTIKDRGEQVLAEVIEAPNSCENLGRRPPYSKIKYNENVFIKRTDLEYCHFVSGKSTVLMLTNEQGDELIFLNEYDPMDFAFSGGIFLIALLISFKYFAPKKKGKPKE